MIIRLQKFMADAGIASRRKSEELILQGKVYVNNIQIKELGTKIDTEKDIVKYKGKKVNIENKKIYILLNKPIGYVTTTKDQFGRESVLDLIKIKERLVTAGRLDMYTSGALILSNDGDFINKITHPKHEIEKTYNVTIKGIINENEIEKLKKGVTIINKEKEYLTKPAKVKILKTDIKNDVSRIQITIHEGKNRQVRKMCEAIDKKVISLHRCKIGNITVKNIKVGNWRYLEKKEIEGLLKK